MELFTRLSDEVLTRLRGLGFVHVTGLLTTAMRGKAPHENVIEAFQDSHGKWYANHGMISLVTLDGQVWLGSYRSETFKDVEELAKEICPKGKDERVFVHCSNGESIEHSSGLFRRFADPYEDSDRTTRRMFSPPLV